MSNKIYYHATRATNLPSIMNDGVIYTGMDGIVYLAESVEDALKFVALRAMNEDIYILGIKGLDESKIQETFDHSYAFFKCKSYGYPEDIPVDLIDTCHISERAR